MTTHRPPPGRRCGPRSECSVGTCRPPALSVVRFSPDYTPSAYELAAAAAYLCDLRPIPAWR
eukprot:5962236-Pyramimonas_sp.AAC.1